MVWYFFWLIAKDIFDRDNYGFLRLLKEAAFFFAVFYWFDPILNTTDLLTFSMHGQRFLIQAEVKKVDPLKDNIRLIDEVLNWLEYLNFFIHRA